MNGSSGGNQVGFNNQGYPVGGYLQNEPDINSYGEQQGYVDQDSQGQQQLDDQYQWQLVQELVNHAKQWNQYPTQQYQGNSAFSSPRPSSNLRQPHSSQREQQEEVVPKRGRLVSYKGGDRHGGIGGYENQPNFQSQPSTHVNFPTNNRSGGLSNMHESREVPKGVVFQCDNTNEQECMENGLFGLPKLHKELVERIEPGVTLFLFNFRSRAMHGIFEASSQGAMNLNPYAFGDGQNGSLFPCQVYVRRIEFCEPVYEQDFWEILKDNYIAEGCFDYELTSRQVEKLAQLMKTQTGNISHWRHPSPQPHHSRKRERSNDQKGRSNDQRRRSNDQRGRQNQYHHNYHHDKYWLGQGQGYGQEYELDTPTPQPQRKKSRQYSPYNGSNSNSNRPKYGNKSSNNNRFHHSRGDRYGRQHDKRKNQGREGQGQGQGQQKKHGHSKHDDPTAINLGNVIARLDDRTSVCIRNFPRKVRIWDILKVLQCIVPNSFDFFLATRVKHKPCNICVYINLLHTSFLQTLVEAVEKFHFDDLRDIYIRYAENNEKRNRIISKRNKIKGDLKDVDDPEYGLSVVYDKIQGLNQIKDYYAGRLKFWKGSPLAVPNLQLHQPVIFKEYSPNVVAYEEWGDLGNADIEMQNVENAQNIKNVEILEQENGVDQENSKQDKQQGVGVNINSKNDDGITGKFLDILNLVAQKNSSLKEKLKNSSLGNNQNDLTKELEQLEYFITQTRREISLEEEEKEVEEDKQVENLNSNNTIQIEKDIIVKMIGGKNSDVKVVFENGGDNDVLEKNIVSNENGEVGSRDNTCSNETGLDEDFIQLE